MNIPATIKHLFTEQDNETFCPVRLFGVAFAILGSSVFLGLSIWTVIEQHNALRYIAFGTGLASVWATVSGAIIFKAKFGDRK